MSGMARHGSVAAYSGFSVCQPALGAALQWLPAIGTPELDDMIHAFLPGPASIQDKRAHISMDFFEYSRQTGENFKFYPVPSAAFTPATASPASFTSGLNHSPVLSDHGSWTQSPATFVPSPVDVRTKPRASVSKKSSASSSRQHANDFANHPGMRILTKDGRDVTNSASRGCKTKEQRDHAHLMRIIKACDSCRRKKVRCDPSHKKRSASQASPSQTELKPAKKPKKTEEPPRVAVAGSADEFLVADALDAPETTLSFPTFEPQEFEEFWNDFITFDPQPTAVHQHMSNDFLFDGSIDSVDSFSSSTGSSSASPSQVFTPTTSAVSRTSPSLSSDVAVDVAADAECSLHNPTVPYLNPGVAHGTNYVDFNLFSPSPDSFDDDSALQMIDLASEQHQHISISTTASPAVVGTGAVAVGTARAQQARSPRCNLRSQHPTGAAVSPSANVPNTLTDISWSDPGSTLHDQGQVGGRHSISSCRPAIEPSPIMPCVSRDYRHVHTSVWVNGASTVSARIRESSVSRGNAPGGRMRAASVHSSASSPTVLSTVSSGVDRSGVVGSPASYSPVAPTCDKSSPRATHTASPTALNQSPKAADGTVPASPTLPCSRQSCTSTVVQNELSTAGLVLGSGSSLEQPKRRQRAASVRNGVPALAGLGAFVATANSTLPTRRNVAGKEGAEEITSSPLFFQLAVFGLVSVLCASSAARLASCQVSLVNLLLVTMSLSLARLAPLAWWGAGSPTLPSSSSSSWPSTSLSRGMPSGFLENVKAKIQTAVGRSQSGHFRSTARRRGSNSLLLLSSSFSARLLHVQ
ncbi:hypothetical protein VTK26DRAFT_6327 [Humicola hyalothermophila]